MYGAFDTDGFSHLLDEIDIRESMTIKEASIAEAECMYFKLRLHL